MKNRNLINVLMFTALSSLVIGCKQQPPVTSNEPSNQPSEVPSESSEEKASYAITIDEADHGIIAADKEMAKEGETVTLTISPDVGYKLGSLTLNGAALTSETFTMPSGVANVKATFVCDAETIEIPNTALKLSSTSELKKGQSSWDVTFGENGMNIKVYVQDDKIVLRDNFAGSDGVRILFSKNQRKEGYINDVTSKLQVKADGSFEFAVYNGTNFVTPTFNANDLSVEANYFSNSGVLAGYTVDIFVNYSLLNVTAANAKNELTFCPVYLNNNNTTASIITASVATPSDFAVVEKNQNTYMSVIDNNTYQKSNHIYSTGQLALPEGTGLTYWDISKDYLKEDPNFANREATLSGGDLADNILYFYENNGPELYLEATFTLTDVYNQEQWGKFGFQFKKADGDGFIYYMDASGVLVGEMTTNRPACVTNHPGGAFDWASSRTLGGLYIPSMDPTVKMAVHRSGSSFEYFINDQKVGNMTSPCNITENDRITPNIFSFNLGLKVTNYYSTSVVSEIEELLPKDNSKGGYYFNAPNELLENGVQWDVSADKAASSGTVKLKGHDGIDNHLFYNVSAPVDGFMYATSHIKLTDYFNLGDAWLKFGLTLFDGEQLNEALFYFVDSYTGDSSKSNNIDNIVGDKLGVCKRMNNNYMKWNPLSTPYRFNLTTKEITMTMVYDNTKVYLFADGQFVGASHYAARFETLYIGMKNFGLGCELTDYYCTTNKADPKIASTMALIPSQEDVVIDGVANDDTFFGYETNNVVATGPNSSTITYSAKVKDGNLYVSATIDCKKLPATVSGTGDGWNGYFNIEFSINDVQSYVYTTSYTSLKEGNYAFSHASVGSDNIYDLACVSTKIATNKYKTVIEFVVPNVGSEATIKLVGAAIDGSKGTIDGQNTYTVNAGGLVLE